MTATPPHRKPLRLTIKPVDADSWADFDALFTTRGGPSYCWCMAWRAQRKDPKAATKAGRKALMKQSVQDGVPIGLLGYVDGEPVGWCSVAPLDTFRGLRQVADDEGVDRTWAITCFFVRRAWRGQGLTHQLLAGAVKWARRHKAKFIEGYGVAPTSPSYRHMGFVSMFKAAGFEEVGREGTRRHVMRLPLRPTRAAPA